MHTNIFSITSISSKVLVFTYSCVHTHALERHFGRLESGVLPFSIASAWPDIGPTNQATIQTAHRM